MVTIILCCLLAPAMAGIIASRVPRARWALGLAGVGIGAAVVSGAGVIVRVFTQGPVSALDGWVYIDALSAYNLAVLLVVYGLCSLYAWIYFNAELTAKTMTPAQARTFAGLWCGALAAMEVVLVSNNLGIMWAGMEATTLLTAFLIYIHRSRAALEAMWKYLIICSVGVALAFMGTLLAAAAAQGLAADSATVLFWTSLSANAGRLDPMLMKAAFIFLLVGYGTKAGLAPMHSWLPDAHSQAPAPVSAMFSGFMLNTALYCVMRYLPITETATGHSGWALRLVAGLGLVSMLTAAAFVLFQRDLKRLLAYCSVEHRGFSGVGLGLGGAGTVAALFHTFNHALCKTLSFFAAGRLGQATGSHEISKLRGALRWAPVWGAGLFGSLLVLIGIAPSAVFMSEFQTIRAAFTSGRFWIGAFFIVTAGVVFVGMLGQTISLAWGDHDPARSGLRSRWYEVALVVAPLVVLVVLGLWMPVHLTGILEQAAAIIHGPAIVPAAPLSLEMVP